VTHHEQGVEGTVVRRVRQVGGTASCVVTLAALALIVVPAAAQQDSGPAPQDDAGKGPPDASAPVASMTCERTALPGRVRCEVEARVGAGESISWGDVVLRRMPPFASALRGRIGPRDASIREPDLWRWPFALVAREKGAGEVGGQVRVLVCRDRACIAREVPVVGEVDVGP
jgi:hypothetical protein